MQLSERLFIDLAPLQRLAKEGQCGHPFWHHALLFNDRKSGANLPFGLWIAPKFE